MESSKQRHLVRRVATVAAIAATLGIVTGGMASAATPAAPAAPHAAPMAGPSCDESQMGKNDKVPAIDPQGPAKDVYELTVPLMAPLDAIPVTAPVAEHLKHYHLKDLTWEYRSLTGAPDENVKIHGAMVEMMVGSLMGKPVMCE